MIKFYITLLLLKLIYIQLYTVNIIKNYLYKLIYINLYSIVNLITNQLFLLV